VSHTHQAAGPRVVIGAAHSRGHARAMAPRSITEAFGPHARLTIAKIDRNPDRLVGVVLALAMLVVGIGLATGLIP
jgi:hypothetical protein